MAYVDWARHQEMMDEWGARDDYLHEMAAGVAVDPAYERACDDAYYAELDNAMWDEALAENEARGTK